MIWYGGSSLNFHCGPIFVHTNLCLMKGCVSRRGDVRYEIELSIELPNKALKPHKISIFLQTYQT